MSLIEETSFLANNNRQTKDIYPFTVDNSSEANSIDWYNAYFEVYFKLVKTANGVGITEGINIIIVTKILQQQQMVIHLSKS